MHTPPPRPPAPTHRRAILNGPVSIDLPDDLGGTQTVRFTDDGLMRVELELDEILDRLNARLERAGEEPFESVWEALEDLTARYPIVTIRVLLAGALPDLKGREIPLRVLNDPTIAEALTEALSLSFGTDPAELPQEETERLDPPVAGADAGGSTGGPSTPSGPDPSPSEA